MSVTKGKKMEVRGLGVTEVDWLFQMGWRSETWIGDLTRQGNEPCGHTRGGASQHREWHIQRPWGKQEPGVCEGCGKDKVPGRG